MIVQKTTLLVFTLMVFLMNSANAVVSQRNGDLTIQAKAVNHPEINNAPKEKISFWKTLKELRKLKRGAKKTMKSERGDGKLLIAWGLLLIIVPFIVKLLYRTIALTGWAFLSILLIGLIILIVGLVRWLRRRN